MEKASRLLGFTPRYSSLEAVQEAVRWLVANGKVARSARLVKSAHGTPSLTHEVSQ
jgi:hypothetical protein